MTTAGTETVPCPRCGEPMDVVISVGPGLAIGGTYEVLLHVDEFEQGEHYLTCASREETA